MLLDTNAVIWMLTGHPRARPLMDAGRLYVSPVCLLELQFLLEVGRLSAIPGRFIDELATDPRWWLDSPASEALFAAARAISWTRDPFDRLLVGHARCRRWVLATGDRRLADKLGDQALFL